ncbi:hypothetical protein BU24DRAFT_454773 [Aaosphaeria arxii CBS 175.79]|uniref:Tat pathway signal sequence n=1 Tax=Aaosphaeria arxii CBS 175.79 TaxID=1450172 RepID=A0A6A5XC48_9PLEO|nr:uncharacterized protein BU24DRAFT_454773 [Aaosphaeria arxii CBS 175.79]KAF2010396.1 hypothetical protein BU24DRAFT_454773 [Aaosphaeria arxii CBS 175.79]
MSRNSSLDDSEKGLLDDSNVEDTQQPVRRGDKLVSIHGMLAIFIHTVIALGYMTALYFYMRTPEPQDRLYSPANAALKFESRTVHGELDDNNPYKGPPSPELDAAWHDLLAPTAIRASKEDMDRMNRTSIPLEDGSGYFVTLDVYHQLHCLKYIRHSIHPEYYTINESNKEEHLDHCLDVIRQYIMCNADVTVNTYTWRDDKQKPWPVFTSKHKCVDWDALHGWALDHSFDGFDPALIRHPGSKHTR